MNLSIAFIFCKNSLNSNNLSSDINNITVLLMTNMSNVVVECHRVVACIYAPLAYLYDSCKSILRTSISSSFLGA